MRRPSALLIVVTILVACAGLTAWHRVSERNGGMSPPQSGALWLLSWPQRALSGVGGWFGDVGRTMFSRGGIVRDNAGLRGRVADLEGENQRLRRYLRENQKLRQLLQMPRTPSGKSVSADVVSLDATDYARRIVLNVGTSQGVRPKDAVYAAQGVVGQVVTVAPLSCVVMLMTDQESGLAAMTGRTAAKGVVRGTGERTCKMAYLDYGADVREGDVILTSGYSTIFPKGLVIGRVVKVEREKVTSQLSADIDPAVPFDQLAAVFVRVGAGP